MDQLPDTRFDNPLLNDAFDFSRYPIFKTKYDNLQTSDDPGRSHGGRPQRNVSEPLLLYSSNSMKESWFTTFPFTRSIGDTATLSGDDDICAAFRPNQSITSICETPRPRSWCGADDVNLLAALSPIRHTVHGYSYDIFEDVESHGPKDEKDSFYSSESADRDAHRLLLSMPIIPKIMLERKATIRTLDPQLSPDTAPNKAFLSPRIGGLGAQATTSSRRYGRILSRKSPSVSVRGAPAKGGGRGRFFKFQPFRRFGSTCFSVRVPDRISPSAYTRSVSEPMLKSSRPPDDEAVPLLRKGADESLHSEAFLSMTEEMDSLTGPRGDPPESDISEPLKLKQDPTRYPTPSHHRFPMSRSISFSGIIQAVADGYASFDHRLRKAKTKPKSMDESKSPESPPNPHRPDSKWAPKEGQIKVKVFVPSTDDIWMFCVPQDISLADFTSKVVDKVGFPVSFSGSLWDEPKYHFVTDERFKLWVKGRVRFGRNLPIVAHTPPPPPLVKLNVDGGGCEVWCYA